MIRIVGKITKDAKTIGYRAIAVGGDKAGNIGVEQAYVAATNGEIENCVGVRGENGVYLRGTNGFDIGSLPVKDIKDESTDLGKYLEVRARSMAGTTNIVREDGTKAAVLVCLGFIVRNHSNVDISISTGLILRAQTDTALTKRDVFYLCANVRVGKTLKNAKITRSLNGSVKEDEAWYLAPLHGKKFTVI